MYRRLLALVSGPLAFGIVLVAPLPENVPPPAVVVAALTVWMALWWTFEAVPVAATALLPVLVLPATGTVPIPEVTSPYANPLIFLFLGGFMVAAAMQRWQLHRRIALTILGVVGARPARQVAGFIGATAFLSMWVSNTATTIMMLPIALSLVALEQDRLGEHGENFARALLLGVAYGASVGGIGTLIGTPPNALLAAFLADSHDFDLGFGRWMMVGVPVALVLLVMVWFWLTRVFYRLPGIELADAADHTADLIRELGPPTRAELTVGAVFVLAAAAWVTRPMLDSAIPAASITDAGIAVTATLALFVLPVDGKGTAALDWESARGIPWNVLLLFGGGLSLAGAIESSGLATAIGHGLGRFSEWPTLAVVGITVTLVLVLTTVATNTAVTAAFLPVLAALALEMDIAPLAILAPAAMAASCAFMLPVGTPPNAIVFASGAVRIRDMAKAGFGLSLLTVPLLTLLGYGLVIALLI